MTPRLSLVITLGSLASALIACEPKAPSCGDVSTHVGQMFGISDDYSRDVEGAFLGRCVNDEWSAEVRRCLVGTRGLDQPQNCKAKMTALQGAALDRDLADVEQRQAARVIPQACLDLEVQIAAAQSCEAIPKPVRDQMMTNVAISKKRWASVTDKRLLAPECGAAIQALKQATIECAKPPSTSPAPSPTVPSPTPAPSPTPPTGAPK